MATTAVYVSLAEYMNTVYEPDCDYVDGALEERNVGKRKHSRTQTLLAAQLFARESVHGCRVLTEQRVQVSRSRVRIPDICLVPQDDRDEVIQRPPALWIEILSPEDRWGRIQSRLNDALTFGVRTIWIVDPYSREAWIGTPEHGTLPVEDGILRCSNPELEIQLEEILPAE
jgi:Uma2 family endonuclease